MLRNPEIILLVYSILPVISCSVSCKSLSNADGDDYDNKDDSYCVSTCSDEDDKFETQTLRPVFNDVLLALVLGAFVHGGNGDDDDKVFDVLLLLMCVADD